jgi:hypothetical protein
MMGVDDGVRWRKGDCLEESEQCAGVVTVKLKIVQERSCYWDVLSMFWFRRRRCVSTLSTFSIGQEYPFITLCSFTFQWNNM